MILKANASKFLIVYEFRNFYGVKCSFEAFEIEWWFSCHLQVNIWIIFFMWRLFYFFCFLHRIDKWVEIPTLIIFNNINLLLWKIIPFSHKDFTKFIKLLLVQEKWEWRRVKIVLSYLQMSLADLRPTIISIF